MWIILLIALPLLLNAAVTGLVAWGRTVPESAAQIEQAFAQTIANYSTDMERAYRVYASGSFAEITAQRGRDYMSIGFEAYFIISFQVMAMFLLGVYFGKQGIFRNLEAHRGLFRRLFVWGRMLGLGGNFLYATLILSTPRMVPTGPLLLATAGQFIGAPLLMLAYVSAFCLLMLAPGWGERLSVLAPVGQMALTNDLTQSVVCTTIFYSYGLGLFGQMSVAAGVGLTLLIYGLQIVLSHWWMKRFRYGPAEWLWRSLTYGKFMPMKRSD
ncbi:DUF418 domain-containing protein [Thermoflexus sp.]|uniref:DUF418 domain-containing protein n=1 Tax=Thermoflexus sp. TaxID=1969742 RepID=UPI002ADE5ADB|nr:DUF418 domain-containing protein [Thermoflexus sp.]